MKLLIVTQAVDLDDPVLGFFHQWLLEFAQHASQINVITLYEGRHELPAHVTVHSLGKEHGRRSRLSYAISFKLLAWKLRNEYDHVFVHMNPEYLVIAGPMWKLLGKRTALWYMHKNVSWRLRLGILFADVIFTASPNSMRVQTKKKRVVGHGIQGGELVSAPSYPPLALLTIGRISRIKRVHILIEAFALLRRDGVEGYLTIVGGPAGASGKRYARELHEQAEGLGVLDRVVFQGAVPHNEISTLFAESHLFLHASNTGSLDKASLEPLSAGVPVITADAELALANIPAIVFSAPTAESFAGAIRKAIGARLWDKEEVRREAHRYVMEHHELSRLVRRLTETLEAL
jgi:glycosyltransferase involved in cell wall biosynthesis